jgi:hypothetical protein
MQADELFAALEGGQFLRDVTTKIAEVVAACHRAERHGIDKPKGKLSLAFSIQMDRSTVDICVTALKTDLPKSKRPGTLLFASAKGVLEAGAKGRQSEMFTPDEVRPALIEAATVEGASYAYTPAGMAVETVYGTAPVAAMPMPSPVAAPPVPSPIAAPVPVPVPVASPEPAPLPAETVPDAPKMRVMP